MIEKFFVDKNGNYMGGFSGTNIKIPSNYIEVSGPPERADQKWLFPGWSALTPDETITDSDMIDAMWEKIANGNNTKFDAIKKKKKKKK